MRNEDLFPSDGKFTYPEHPFDPGLCDTIAKLRPGLTDVALAGLLSHQCIALIAQVNSWDQDLYTSLREHDIYSLHEMSTNSRNVTLCSELLQKPGLTLVEQLLILALMGFCYSADKTHAMFWLTNAYLQIHCRYLNAARIEVTDKNEDYMTWISTVLVATFDPGSQAWLLALSILKSRPKPRDWQDNVRLCENYFWNDGLSLRLASKIGYLRNIDVARTDRD